MYRRCEERKDIKNHPLQSYMHIYMHVSERHRKVREGWDVCVCSVGV